MGTDVDKSLREFSECIEMLNEFAPQADLLSDLFYKSIGEWIAKILLKHMNTDTFDEEAVHWLWHRLREYKQISQMGTKPYIP